MNLSPHFSMQLASIFNKSKTTFESRSQTEPVVVPVCKCIHTCMRTLNAVLDVQLLGCMQLLLMSGGRKLSVYLEGDEF